MTASQGEVRWAEIGRTEGVWTIPSERMKAKREHRVPLCHRATEILGEARTLDVATGKVIHQCLPRHRHQEFLRFLRTVEKQSDPELELHFILDNYATHKHAKVKAWLDRHPRVHFHFVPTSSSWLNLVERFFSELTQRQLKRLAVHSVGQLVHAITAYIDDRNRAPKPFVWTATVKDILAKVTRANIALAAVH